MSISLQAEGLVFPVKGSFFPNTLSEFVYKRTYSRWLEDKKRRETWAETVQRYVDFIFSGKAVPSSIIEAIHSSILSMDILPSMRALWSAGYPAERDNTCLYNCSFLPVDCIPAFSEALYILMQGTGVGFSVETQFTDRLPAVAPSTGVVIDYTIPDSTEGWADALKFGITEFYRGNDVRFDFSKIRPKGSILKTKGGRASGPEPLQNLLSYARETIHGASGRKLTSLECHDMMCFIADIVVVGGVRRAAMISFSDVEDLEMRHAKDWTRGQFPKIRYMANNSSYFGQRPSEEVFWAEWGALKASGSGERGFSTGNWHQRADRPEGLVRSNPCHEIGLRFTLSEDPWTGAGGSGQFCNLSAAVMRPWDTTETMAEKVRLATWLGCVQASYTHFPYLRDGWRNLCEEDRLLGVDITGHCDNPRLSRDGDVMTYLNAVARSTSILAADQLEINRPVAVACGKPSGNSSQLVDCASGFHTRYSKYYYRHCRISSHDPLFKLMQIHGVPVFKENGEEDLPDDQVSTWVVRFPVKSPEGSVLREHETAIDQCNRYLEIMNTWCSTKGHNQSATIYIRDDEWEEVGNWLWENFDSVCGLSFLPYDGGNYRLAPYMEITEEEYEKAKADFPIVDWSLLSVFETEDRGGGAQEYACVGGSCEL